LSGIATPALARAHTVYPIGVDNAGPAGHDFEYVDFFPRAGVRVHRGDVLDFKWNKGSIDGAHTATLVPPGATVPGLFAPDSDDPGGQLQFNPAMFAPSDPSCGNTSNNPCVYDGTKLVNSGFKPNAPGGDFFVRLTPPLGGDGDDDNSTVVNFLCEVHPGMSGSVKVVSDRREASELDDVRDHAEDQLDRDTHDALRAEDAVDESSVKLNPDGKTHTVTLTAGTATPFVEVVEMLPRKANIRAGDTVNWVTRTIKDPHTVTFPEGPASFGVDPLPTFCEGSPDKPALVPSDCSSPAAFEVHLVPQPIGGTVISSPNTVATSGIIGNTHTTGLPDHYAFSFPNAGTFDYMCRIHDHMVGEIVARK
jgi:plastocyanin